MRPILLTVHGYPLYSYGAMVAAGLVLSVIVARRLAARAGMPELPLFRLILVGFLIGTVGCRLLYVITQPDEFLEHPLRVFRFWEGRAFLGGPLATVAWVIWYCRRYRVSMWQLGDLTLPGLALGQSLGRIGCFLAGCCHGRPTSLIVGMRFDSAWVEPSLRGIPVHPTQLYEAALDLILFGFLLWLFRRRRFDGQVSLSYFIGYAMLRFPIEFVRGDDDRQFVMGDWLSTSQFLSCVIVGIAVPLLITRWRRHRRDPEQLVADYAG